MRKQRSDFENLPIASKYFLQQLGAKVTPQTIERQLTTHPAYPSVLSLSETLSDLSIENMAVSITTDRLEEVPYPAIAHFSRGHFVVLDGLENGQLTYFDPAKGHVTQSVEEFAAEWSGVLLMAELDEETHLGEADFIFKKYRTPLIIGASMMFFVLGLVAGFVNFKVAWATWLPLLGLKAVGLTTAVLLILKEEGISNALVHKICDTNAKTSCGQVLDSPAAKLFGWLKMSHLGFIYFAGGSLALLTSLTSGNLFSIAVCLGVFTILALPYTIFSVYYQAMVVKKWCLLCLAVQLIFWLEFAAGFSLWSYDSRFFNATSILHIAVTFGVVVVFWLLFKPGFRLKKELLEQEAKLNFFLKNEQIMRGVLESAPHASPVNFEDQVILGDPEAPIEVTMISNVFCGPCAQKHEALVKLMRELPGILRVQVLFTAKKEQEDEQNKVSQHLIGLHYQYNQAQCLEATSFWYKHKDYTALVKNYPLTEDSLEKAKNLHIQHAYWVDQEQITGTPTLLVQGRQLPVGFDLENFKSYWRNMAMVEDE
ncbi:vitamin K epoxide reductase family protein [Microscilla marina]|uniref:Peptidase, C39 family n=1 Tax=Microscilla marina ATCC 23134 TaxID=313606 RepID=A1ZYE7_MICM2|nr:cysteine peptidase family C39 domain-containing protein [Microscilla marina]EAY24620.1 peptidase, C39 family [Microscilla marina ATCC 23134]